MLFPRHQNSGAHKPPKHATTTTISLLAVTALLCSGSGSRAFAQEAKDPRAALKTDLEKISQKTETEIAQWKTLKLATESLMVEPNPDWPAAAARVETALRGEIEARQKLYEADLAVLDASAGVPSQPIYAVRPLNAFGSENDYADKMIGIIKPRIQTAEGEPARMQLQAEGWKKQYGDKDFHQAIDRWLELVNASSAMPAKAVDLYSRRDESGWYDRACLADKFDSASALFASQAARKELDLRLESLKKTEPNPDLAKRIELLNRQRDAALAVHQAGKSTYEAMSAFNALMTRESPLCKPRATEFKTSTVPPWDLQRLGQPPKYRWLDDKSPVRTLLFRGESYQGNPTDVFAYYATPGTLAGNPTMDKNLPALVLLHGGGDRASREWVTFWAQKGYAAISMDLAGCGPNTKGEYDKLFKPERLLRGGPGQDGTRKFLDIDEAISDQWSYHAVANAILAHSLIRTLPGIDSDRTAVAGISWGGYLTCIVAGVDPRFKAAMPFYGCGFVSENSVWKEQGIFDKLTGEQTMRWNSLWDPSIYAPKIKIPIFCVTGANDFAYPMESFSKTYALPQGERRFRITPDMGHGGQFLTSTPEAVVFMDSILRGGKPLPSVKNPLIDSSGATAEVSGDEIASAQFHYTTAEGPNKSRTWVAVNAEVKGQQLIAPAPPADMKCGYFTITTANKITVSSEPVVKGP